MALAKDKVQHVKNFVGGAWTESIAERYEEVPNPATGETIAYVPISSREELDRAVTAAKEAYKTWKTVAVPRRARILFKYQQLLVEHWDELARLITIENGKSYEEAYGEVQRGIECVEFAAGAPTLMMGTQLPDIATGVESGMYRYPIGVVGGITPFNFPMMVPCWMFPLAIACGNTFVLKPSERTPLLANRLAELFVEAGLPEGVLNVVHGAHDVVNGILENPDVKAVSFVGSQPVAEYVYKTAAANGKRVQALAGAKNHSIVMPDADLDNAVKNIIGAAFGSAGERCMACAVVVAVGDIADELVHRLILEAEQIKIGNGLDEGVFLGPVIRDAHKARTIGYIEAGEKEGARLVRDGRKDQAVDGAGYFVGPTIFDNVTTEMSIWKDEIFAPVLSVVRVKDLDEAIELTNQSEFANGACLYTDSAKAVRQFRDDIDAGMLGINLGVPAPMAFFPFSGYKKSFYGDLHANGRDGVEFYTRKKMLTARY
ncbi:CoA-acylating methylmalonate-semialdehyde dehydrogenase [Aneurinibacillus aneurinilyticus]|jgi:malonate-semialdehyde dehydrogenase (acetylating)/methylmalonate-semialdehyde dehydrogenase|uniref:Malonate-semialdehyde dehydrogenase n=2 Tax=Aneurinibacillus aneurinilyticus TaxID=1391 RepID=A0A848D368_ANEAE|nr:CoA-acylating methylmalonate-semialdehyde dehydrogenase [Aneurinibacillus aneurinilyticus]ERI11827.1 methylmalonate-semialdehyde dehydrogenase [Aneurinibacillus aneurinilyticus ATCC 12856]MED0708886.1 CoA-acylating methylmalonate-semialdehyde dehydrogenase [Aneurinibacillus aneurinilyticus]MED0724378.1 CoA-acylating methylmalonate-semialdehyde dehydrogenase [Aneurinibacillus aneurinilyticus]MED0735159.1 CoA-acylating methylmalonate-semialdehyde dehydrogenase [Aneurinibacillus aneurinilyticus